MQCIMGNVPSSGPVSAIVARPWLGVCYRIGDFCSCKAAVLYNETPASVGRLKPMTERYGLAKPRNKLELFTSRPSVFLQQQFISTLQKHST